MTENLFTVDVSLGHLSGNVTHLLIDMRHPPMISAAVNAHGEPNVMTLHKLEQ